MNDSTGIRAYMSYALVTGLAVLSGVLLWLFLKDGAIMLGPAALSVLLLTVSRVSSWGTVRSIIARIPGNSMPPLGVRSGITHACVDVGCVTLLVGAAWLATVSIGQSASDLLRGLELAIVILAGVAILFCTPSPLVLRSSAPRP
jgi:hypothetical protein